MCITAQSRELEKELKLRSDEVNKLQLTIAETKRDMHVKKMQTLCQSNITKLDIPSISQADASVQASLPVSKPEMREAQVSPLKSITTVSKSIMTSPPVTHRSHKRTYSDGDVLLQQKQLLASVEDNYIKIDLCQTSSRRISGKLCKSALEKQKGSQTVPTSEREYGCNSIWHHKAKSLHRQLNATSEQVMLGVSSPGMLSLMLLTVAGISIDYDQSIYIKDSRGNQIRI